MTTKRSAIVLGTAVLMGLLGTACNRDEPPPMQLAQASIEGGGRLLPVRMPKVDKGILGAAGSTETAAKAEAGGGAASAEKVTIDDSTADAAAQSLANILKAGSLSQLPDIVIPDQREVVGKVVGIAQSVQSLVAAQAELKSALDAKFPGHAIRLGDPGAAAALNSGLPREVTVTDIKPVNDDEADATWTSQGPNGETTKPLKIRKIEGKWRVELPEMPPAEVVETIEKTVAPLADAIKGVTAKVNSGEIADAQAAEQALKDALGAPSTPQGAPGSNDAKPAPEEKKAEANADKPKPRERDDVDQSYSGPGMLRAR